MTRRRPAFILLFLLVQKHVVRSIAVGAVKG
jgi:ABC-type maltose transport system permease subunit